MVVDVAVQRIHRAERDAGAPVSSCVSDGLCGWQLATEMTPCDAQRVCDITLARRASLRQRPQQPVLADRRAQRRAVVAEFPDEVGGLVDEGQRAGAAAILVHIDREVAGMHRGAPFLVARPQHRRRAHRWPPGTWIWTAMPALNRVRALPAGRSSAARVPRQRHLGGIAVERSQIGRHQRDGLAGLRDQFLAQSAIHSRAGFRSADRGRCGPSSTGRSAPRSAP
jgi:hypothetical protein